MGTYVGEFECKIDVKGRLLLPAGLLKQFPDQLKERFVISKSVFDKCLILNPMDSWQELMNKFKKLNPRFNRQHNEFIRRFTDGNILVEMDSSNRVLIPKNLLDFGKIKSDIVLTCNLDTIEIWSAKEYKNKMNSFDPDGFASLAEEVMGKMNNWSDGNELS